MEAPAPQPMADFVPEQAPQPAHDLPEPPMILEQPMAIEQPVI